MARCIVTGAAGFIGSHLAEALVQEGSFVVGVDSFTDYYPRKLKLANIQNLLRSANFRLCNLDLATGDLQALVRNVDYVFHLAGQPGVRASWGAGFSAYLRNNPLATQRLLEAVKGHHIKKLIFASSSSIYGNSERFPTKEVATPKPISPYGISKLAGEHLCLAYLGNFEVPSVILRYFTVYGPRQRPDMAFNGFISKISSGHAITVYGDGTQKRDFTYVDDIVNASILAMKARSGSIYNVGGGKSTSLNEVLGTIESLVGKKAKIRHANPARGDVKSTSADISKIAQELGYRPSTPLRAGIRKQIEALSAKHRTGQDL